MRITLTEQLEVLAKALENAEAEADYSAGVAHRQNPALCDDLWNLTYELRRLVERVQRLQYAPTQECLPAGVR